MLHTSQTVREERPESPLARGRWSASPWLVGAIAVATLFVTVAFLVLYVRRRVRERHRDEAPVSSRGRGRPRST